jgi:hypothetical protein
VKRDMNLIRLMLLKIEAGHKGNFSDVAISGYDSATLRYHSLLLGESGLVDGYADYTKEKLPYADGCFVTGLHPLGHEVVALARDERVWEQVSKRVAAIGGAPLEIWLRLLGNFEMAKK